MKSTGVVRRIDDLGRIVIPKEIRRSLRIREGDSLEIYIWPRLGQNFKFGRNIQGTSSRRYHISWLATTNVGEPFFYFNSSRLSSPFYKALHPLPFTIFQGKMLIHSCKII